jgi:hypothetical protein
LKRVGFVLFITIAGVNSLKEWSNVGHCFGLNSAPYDDIASLKYITVLTYVMYWDFSLKKNK